MGHRLFTFPLLATNKLTIFIYIFIKKLKIFFYFRFFDYIYIDKTKEEFISNYPNVVEVSVTDKNCQYLITDDLGSSSSKMKAAEKKGVKIVTYGSFKL